MMRAMGHFSTARVTRAWYVACRSEDLRHKPIARKILDTPLVLFRHQERAVCLLDRCAHRNVPLSLGWCENDRLVCSYHGWAYDGDGVCREVPALCGEQTGKGRRVPLFPVREQQGYIWVWADSESAPVGEPFLFPKLDDRAYESVRHESTFTATLHASLENILDVPHTAFLHRGLFRGVKRNKIRAVVRKSADRVEAQYIGEPTPVGVMGKILAPQGGEIFHFDRFILPSIAQVEYGLGDRNHLFVTSALTPVSDFETELFAVATFRTALPTRMLKPILYPLGKKVLEQDQRMLKEQTDAIRRFGGEQYVSTDVDLLGPHILRLLKQAERGDAPTESSEREVELLA
jgi:phenylpropionate dioxygenase-like ring-hydroxylating dioxygenase large terminal subunit